MRRTPHSTGTRVLHWQEAERPKAGSSSRWHEGTVLVGGGEGKGGILFPLA